MGHISWRRRCTAAILLDINAPSIGRAYKRGSLEFGGFIAKSLVSVQFVTDSLDAKISPAFVQEIKFKKLSGGSIPDERKTIKGRIRLHIAYHCNYVLVFALTFFWLGRDRNVSWMSYVVSAFCALLVVVVGRMLAKHQTESFSRRNNASKRGIEHRCYRRSREDDTLNYCAFIFRRPT
jgi:hypothetical protein